MAQLSKAEKLLVAAGALAKNGHSEFTAEDLVVQAHREFPDDFSLKGYRECPDSNVVLTQIMGKKAHLLVRGWLEKIGIKQYRLTPKGLDDLPDLGGSESTIVNRRIERNFEEGLARLLTFAAFQLFKSRQQDRITFHQFCRFAGLSARDKWQKVAGKLRLLEHLVGKAKVMGESGEGLNIYVGNHNETYDPDELRLLAALLEYLMTQFRKQMVEWEQHASG